MIGHRSQLLDIFSAGLAAVNGEQAVYQALAETGKRQPCHVIAIGKAADSMLQGAYRYFGEQLQTALMITKHAHTSEAIRNRDNVQVLESSHPVPDETSLQAGQALIAYLQQLPQDARLLFLVSGGASSLVEVLDEGWTLEKLQEKTCELLTDGSPINEINALRRQISRIKGGKLWNYLGKQGITCLLISDVPGDDPEVIGSGLLFPAPTEDFSWQIVASNRQALEAMQAACDDPKPVMMPDFLEGNAEIVAQLCVGHLRDSKPGIYLWGAETTVLLPPEPGRGGRNQHLALAVALHLQPDENILLLATGTDGTDGVTADAGGLVDAGSRQRGESEGLDPLISLNTADAGNFLEASGDLIHTGPTGTNVMDVIIGLKF